MSKYGTTYSEWKMRDLEKEKLYLNRTIGYYQRSNSELERQANNAQKYSISVTGLFICYIALSFIF
jgi:hypothetical protein